MQRTKERYYRDPESRRQYHERKKGNPLQEKDYNKKKKKKIRKILSQKKNMKIEISGKS